MYRLEGLRQAVRKLLERSNLQEVSLRNRLSPLVRETFIFRDFFDTIIVSNVFLEFGIKYLVTDVIISSSYCLELEMGCVLKIIQVTQGLPFKLHLVKLDVVLKGLQFSHIINFCTNG